MLSFDKVISEYNNRGVAFTKVELKELRSSSDWLKGCCVCSVCDEILLHDDEAYDCQITGKPLCDDHSASSGFFDEGYISTNLILSEDEFDAKFTMIKNSVVEEESSLDDCMFETYGAEFEFVKKYDEKYVWTYSDMADGRICFMAGFHDGHRIGYFITEQSHGNKKLHIDLDCNYKS